MIKTSALAFAKRFGTWETSACVLWLFFLTALAGIAAFYRMFTGFNSYDDEGTILVTIKEYLGGMKLYNQIYIPYGPVYYFYNWAIRTLSGTSVTHDAIRMSSLIPWLLTAFISAWIILRLTGSLVLASGTHLVTSLTLSIFFHNEPGHPQELCILLLIGLVASGILTSVRYWRWIGIVMIGALTAALFLVKVNLGTLAFLAAALAMLAHSPKTKLSRLALIGVAVASVLIPIILMRPHLQNEPTRMYAILVVFSMIAVLLMLFRASTTIYFSFRDCWIALGSFSITFAGIILVLKAHGIDLNAMVHALLLDSLSTYVIRGSWFVPLPADPGWLPWIIGGLAAALYFLRDAVKIGQRENEALYLKLVVSVFALVALYRGVPQYKLVLPFCWLVLYEPAGNVLKGFPRTLLCTATVLQTLYAYPIAGSQFSFIQVLPVIVLMTFLGDLFLWQQKRLSVISPLLIRTAALLLLLWVVKSYLVTIRSEIQVYNSLPALRLPGSERIHLPPDQARDYPWLAQNINDYCDTFIGFPEFGSLHIWTGKDAVAGMEIDDWMYSASDEQQIRVSAMLSQHPNACAIYNPDLVSFWNRSHQDWNSLPLIRFLRENFKVVAVTGPFYLLVRNERNVRAMSPAFKVPLIPSKMNELSKLRDCIGINCGH